VVHPEIATKGTNRKRAPMRSIIDRSKAAPCHIYAFRAPGQSHRCVGGSAGREQLAGILWGRRSGSEVRFRDHWGRREGFVFDFDLHAASPRGGLTVADRLPRAD